MRDLEGIEAFRSVLELEAAEDIKAHALVALREDGKAVRVRAVTMDPDRPDDATVEVEVDVDVARFQSTISTRVGFSNMPSGRR